MKPTTKTKMEMKSSPMKSRSKKVDYTVRNRKEVNMEERGTKMMDSHLNQVREDAMTLQTESQKTERKERGTAVKQNRKNDFRSPNKYGKKSSDNEVHFDLIEHIGSIGASNNGWIREVNILSWNDANPGLDIRHWSEDHLKMSRGINLSLKECENLRVLLAGMDLSAYA